MTRSKLSLIVAIFVSALPFGALAEECGEDVACWRRRHLSCVVNLEKLPLLEQKADLAQTSERLWKDQAHEAWQTVDKLKPFVGAKPWYEHGALWAGLGFLLGAGITIGVVQVLKR